MTPSVPYYQIHRVLVFKVIQDFYHQQQPLGISPGFEAVPGGRPPSLRREHAAALRLSLPRSVLDRVLGVKRGGRVWASEMGALEGPPVVKI